MSGIATTGLVFAVLFIWSTIGAAAGMIILAAVDQEADHRGEGPADGGVKRLILLLCCVGGPLSWLLASAYVLRIPYGKG